MWISICGSIIQELLWVQHVYYGSCKPRSDSREKWLGGHGLIYMLGGRKLGDCLGGASGGRCSTFTLRGVATTLSSASRAKEASASSTSSVRTVRSYYLCSCRLPLIKCPAHLMSIDGTVGLNKWVKDPPGPGFLT